MRDASTPVLAITANGALLGGCQGGRRATELPGEVELGRLGEGLSTSHPQNHHKLGTISTLPKWYLYYWVSHISGISPTTD